MANKDEVYSIRRGLTFAQAEGVEPLPDQWVGKQISDRLRSNIWAHVYSSVSIRERSEGSFFADPWATIIINLWIDYSCKPVDEYVSEYRGLATWARDRYLKSIFNSKNYVEIFGALQYVLRSPNCPREFTEKLQQILERERSSFRIVGGDTFCPVGSTYEAKVMDNALVLAGQFHSKGAEAHLRAAAKAASEGSFSDSVRESIHAVESVARSLSKSGKLSDALAALEKKGLIHEAMKSGFVKLYGFTSDEKGIRHPLLEGNSASVSEANALFMLGACASFVSYMITRARELES